MLAQATAQTHLTHVEIRQTLGRSLDRRHTGERVLVLIPDTRTVPLPLLFRVLVETLHDAQQLDFMVALGTHPPLSEAQLRHLVGLSAEERTGKSTPHRPAQPRLGLGGNPGPNGHPALGPHPSPGRGRLAPLLVGDVPVRINRHIYDYDHILILGPSFPHEVAGFSGGAKNLPRHLRPEMINVSHWLGARWWAW